MKSTNSAECEQQQTSPLFNLPEELKHLIFNQINTVKGLINFRLVCREAYYLQKHYQNQRYYWAVTIPIATVSYHNRISSFPKIHTDQELLKAAYLTNGYPIKIFNSYYHAQQWETAHNDPYSCKMSAIMQGTVLSPGLLSENSQNALSQTVPPGCFVPTEIRSVHPVVGLSYDHMYKTKVNVCDNNSRLVTEVIRKNKFLPKLIKYDSNYDGQAKRYSTLFAETRALLSGKRKLFANTRAVLTKKPNATLFADTCSFFKGKRPLFANTRASIKYFFTT